MCQLSKVQHTHPDGRPKLQEILTVLEKLNLAKAFSVGEVVVSSNGHTKPGFIKISTN